MEIRQAAFVSSITDMGKGPLKKMPEFAFIGRSNVGKSSLINMLTNRKDLAKTSNKPGKTQTINHYVINDSWYLVDLPGYGFAKVSKDLRQGFGKIIDHYMLKSESLFFVFVLIDIRLEPQAIDQSFIAWAGSNEIPMGIIFTKADKLGTGKISHHVERYKEALLKQWEELPPIFVTSAEKKTGKDEVLDFIEKSLPTGGMQSQRKHKN
jgi:GTP-binding protein